MVEERVDAFVDEIMRDWPRLKLAFYAAPESRAACYYKGVS